MNYSTLKTTHNKDKSITHKNIENLIAYAQIRVKRAQHWTEKDYWTARIKLLNKFKKRINEEELKIAENLKYTEVLIERED